MSKAYKGSMDKISISLGNTHLGKRDIMNMSLPPIKTCAKLLPCFKHCFALRCYKLRTNARKAWDRNLSIYNSNPDSYFSQIQDSIRKRNPKIFRFHVSGDIPSQDYYDRMIKTVKMFPNTLFNCYTKKYNLRFGRRPKNLDLRISVWPDLPYPAKLNKFPKAFIVGDKRITRGLYHCDKSIPCIDCLVCWNKQDVVFDLNKAGRK